MTPDNELLERYAKTGSEDAFAELVRRSIDLVYSAALRQVGGDAHLAQDVAQTVFADLARRAGSLSRRQTLTGWLYTSAHFAAAKIVRTETRRRDREERYMREPIHENASHSDWEKLRPALDAAMHELKQSDCEAVLLRYFENRPFAEVGAKLELNENAARMRVERAVEKLRALLAKRGITTGAALVSVISANAVQTAPVPLATTLATSALAGGGTGALTFMKMITGTKLKLAVSALATAGAVVALVAQHQAQNALRAENESLLGQIAQLKASHSELSNRLAAAGDSQAAEKEQLDELLKLRAEVARLRVMKIAPVAATSPAISSLPATKRTEQIVLKVRFVSVATQFMPNFGAGWTSVGPDTSLLSEQQLAVVIAALRNRDANLISESQVLTLSGRQADAAVIQAVPIDGTNANIGAMLDVLPFFSSNSSIFTLNLAAQLSQLTGDPSQPGVRSIQASNQVNLAPGQTAALKADLPPGGWLPDSTNMLSDGPQNLLVFVTPTLVDESGNKVQISQNKSTTETARQKMNDAKQAILALTLFADANQDRYPTNLAAAAQYLKEGDMDQITSDFDLLAPASITNITDKSSIIVLREKAAWQTPNGKWAKTYGFADGHSEVHVEPMMENFDDFEKNRIVSASVQ